MNSSFTNWNFENLADTQIWPKHPREKTWELSQNATSYYIWGDRNLVGKNICHHIVKTSHFNSKNILHYERICNVLHYAYTLHFQIKWGGLNIFSVKSGNALSLIMGIASAKSRNAAWLLVTRVCPLTYLPLLHFWCLVTFLFKKNESLHSRLRRV